MGNIQEFLSKRDIDQETKEINIDGIPFPFVIKAIGQSQNKEIKKTCQKTFYDKKTNQRTVETDIDLYNVRLVAACCITPNFKDAQFQSEKGVIGEAELMERVLKPGEFYDLLMAVQSICGFDIGINEEIDEAKN